MMLVKKVLLLVVWCGTVVSPGYAFSLCDNNTVTGVQATITEPVPAGHKVYFINTSQSVSLVKIVPDGYNAYFHVTNNTVFTSKVISLDNDTALCGTIEPRPTFTITVLCSGTGTQSVFVHITEVNNYPPVLSPDLVTRVIREQLPKNEVVFNMGDVNVTDEDCPSAKFVQGGNTTDLSYRADDNTIITLRTFDYENINERQFEITVNITDSNPPDHVTPFTLVVKVEDVDDEKPAFLNSSYSLHVQERNESMSGIWLDATPPVEARDQDFGLNTPVIYSIKDVSPSSPNPNITIHVNNSQLMVNGKLDRETVEKYNVILKAEQIDNRLQSVTATLTLYVDDSNDNRPLFNPVQYNISIQEHTAVGTNVIRVIATDADEYPNNMFTYHLEPNTDVFRINNETGYIEVKNDELLDRETTPIFTVTVVTKETQVIVGSNCSDPSCTAIVTVTLIDINDNSPKFVEESYEFAATNVTGSLIGQVNATDDDIDENGEVEYSIPDTQSSFSINETGWISQSGLVGNDKEYLLVEACDAGQQRRCTATIVIITFPEDAIISIDDNVNITENVPIATTVYIIPMAYAGYDLSLHPNSGPFKRTTKTSPGVLVTDGDIDREDISSYIVYINVTVGTEVKAVITVDIRVLDQNDNAPIFNRSSYEFSVDDDAKPGDELDRVAAYDLDEGSNGKITFNIQGIQSSEYFEIDPDDGLFKLKKTPDLAQEFTEVVVVATDNGDVPLKTTTVVKMYVGRKPGKVRFFAPAGRDDVVGDQDELISGMTNILGVNVAFDEVRPVTSPYGSSCAIYLTATKGSTRATSSSGAVSEDELRSLVDDKYDDLLALFSKYQRQAAPVEQGPFTTLVIVLIAVVAAILLASIIIIAIICRRTKKYRRGARLISHLTPKNTIYETQEVREDMDEEASVHSLAGSLSTEQLLGQSHPNGDAIAVQNPGYESSESNHGEENQDTVTQMTHIEDEPAVTEDVIVDLSPDNSPEQETGETNPDLTATTEEATPPDPDYIDVETEDDTVSKAVDNEPEVQPVETEGEDMYATVNKHRADGIAIETDEGVLPPPPVVDPDDGNVGNEEEEEDLPPPPPTPPRQRASHSEEEELDESPEEPEPDYAKKVRFSEVKVQVIPEPEPKTVEEEGDGAETDDEDFTTKNDRRVDTIENPITDISDEGTFVMTSL